MSQAKKTYRVRVQCRETGKTMHLKSVTGYRLAKAAFPNYRANRRFSVKVSAEK